MGVPVSINGASESIKSFGQSSFLAHFPLSVCATDDADRLYPTTPRHPQKKKKVERFPCRVPEPARYLNAKALSGFVCSFSVFLFSMITKPPN